MIDSMRAPQRLHTLCRCTLSHYGMQGPAVPPVSCPFGAFGTWDIPLPRDGSARSVSHSYTIPPPRYSVRLVRRCVFGAQLFLFRELRLNTSEFLFIATRAHLYLKRIDEQVSAPAVRPARTDVRGIPPDAACGRTLHPNPGNRNTRLSPV